MDSLSTPVWQNRAALWGEVEEHVCTLLWPRGCNWLSRAGATSQVGQVSSTFRAAAAIDNMREPLWNRSCVSMHDLRYDKWDRWGKGVCVCVCVRVCVCACVMCVCACVPQLVCVCVSTTPLNTPTLNHLPAKSPANVSSQGLPWYLITDELCVNSSVNGGGTIRNLNCFS